LETEEREKNIKMEQRNWLWELIKS
jgi:hypothetical protein